MPNRDCLDVPRDAHDDGNDGETMGLYVVVEEDFIC